MNLPENLREYLRTIGRRGGLKGGKARWRGVSAAERSELARKAIQARWKKRKRKK